MIPFSVLALALAAPAASDPAPAFDGSQNLVCAITEMQQCRAGEACRAISPADANVPRFLRFDFKKKTISGRRPDDSMVSTPIGAQSKLEDALAMQGMEGAYSWAVSLGKDGDLGVTITSATYSAVAFGACTSD